MIYDYAFADLTPATRDLIHQTMVRRAGMQFPAFKVKFAYLQNHTWINATGLLAAGLALFDEEPAAADWIALPLQITAQSNRMLSPDGASQEGFGYWQYGVDYLLKLMALAKPTGQEYRSPWWDHTADYCLSMMLPRHAWELRDCQNDNSDAPRYTWYGPDAILRALAARNHDGVAQWQAEQVDAAGVDTPIASWENLLWYDPAVKAVAPAGVKPTFRLFDNMGEVSARSDWSGDESWLFFKAGNPLGRFAPDQFPAFVDLWDVGHVHRDSNHFALFGNGEWLIRNSVYGSREAKLHNTLVVADQGQIGDGKTRLAPFQPGQDYARIVEAQSTPELDRITGEAAGAYPPGLGVKKFVRHVLFLKPDVLIVADDIALGGAKKLDLFFHPEQIPTVQPDGSYRAEGKRAALRLEELTPEGTTASVATQALPPSHSHIEKTPDNLSAVVIEKTAAAWRNAVALSWSAASQEPVRVALKQDGARWTFTANGRRATLDWDAPPAAP